MDKSQIISSDLYLEDILKLILTVTVNVTDVSICSLWLMDDFKKPKKLQLKVTESINPQLFKYRSLNMNEGLVGMVAKTREPTVINDIVYEHRFKEKEMARKLGLVSVISVPMLTDEKDIIGVLNCYSDQHHKYTETKINRITSVANQAAVLIMNIELIAKSKIIQEEFETRKLVERAINILIEERNLIYPDAFQWIQKRSIDSFKSIRQIAEAVILSEENSIS